MQYIIITLPHDSSIVPVIGLTFKYSRHMHIEHIVTKAHKLVGFMYRNFYSHTGN